jgi:hypothetical protein
MMNVSFVVRDSLKAALRQMALVTYLGVPSDGSCQALYAVLLPINSAMKALYQLF